MTQVPAEPKLEATEIAAMQKGVDEFNSGRFFECHDTLEEVWQGMRGPSRNFFQGLIQISVGFYHLGNGNTVGGRSQLEKALRNLAGYGAGYLGMELEELRRQIQWWLDRIDRGEDLRCNISEIPKFQYNPPPKAESGPD